MADVVLYVDGVSLYVWSRGRGGGDGRCCPLCWWSQFVCLKQGEGGRGWQMLSFMFMRSLQTVIFSSTLYVYVYTFFFLPVGETTELFQQVESLFFVCGKKANVGMPLVNVPLVQIQSRISKSEVCILSKPSRGWTQHDCRNPFHELGFETHTERTRMRQLHVADERQYWYLYIQLWCWYFLNCDRFYLSLYI